MCACMYVCMYVSGRHAGGTRAARERHAGGTRVGARVGARVGGPGELWRTLPGRPGELEF